MSTEPSFTPLSGGCRCGQARLRMETAPIITHCCHCRLCQQLSGAPFSNFSMIETGHLTLLQGRTRIFQGAANHQQVQCPDCGCTLWLHRADLGDGIAFVGSGTLDQGGRLPPEAHYFVRSKHPWISLPQGIPAFDTVGDPGKAGARERIMAVLAAGGRRFGDQGRGVAD